MGMRKPVVQWGSTTFITPFLMFRVLRSARTKTNIPLSSHWSNVTGQWLVYNYTETKNENHQPKVAPEYIKEINSILLSRRKASLSLIRRVDTTVPAQGFELPAQY
jgi:hypothetical protein